MIWFLSGYVCAAIAFYTYITVTAVEEPEAYQAAGANGVTGFAFTEGHRPVSDGNFEEGDARRAA